MRKKGIFSGIITVMLLSVIAKLLSFFIELIIAYRFGATKETDVYYLVYSITQIITPMITVGIWKVYMPAYKEKQVLNRHKEANVITDELFSIFTVVCAIFVVFGCIFPTAIIKIFAPGFSGETLRLANALLRIMLPLLIFVTMAVFHSAILQANNEFLKSQIKYVIQHIPTFLYLLFFSRYINIYYLSISLVLGEIFAFILATFFTRNEYRFSIPRHHISKDTKKVLKLVPAACINSIINQINYIVDKAFSSRLNAGSLTYLTYGSKLISLFDGIVTTAFSTALFPLMAEIYAKKNIDRLQAFLNRYLLMLIGILAPFTVLITVYSVQIVTLVFGHGQFDSNSVNQTAIVLLTYGIGLIAMGMNTFFNDIFYITKKTNILAITNFINIFINAFLDYILVNKYQIVGLSLATTVTLYITMIIKMVCIKEYITFNMDSVKGALLIVCSCSAGLIPTFLLKVILGKNSIIGFLCGAISFMLIYILILMRSGTVFHAIVKELMQNRKK